MRRALIGLILILLFDVWLRGHTFGPAVRERVGVGPWPVTAGATEPLDCDEAAYAYIGRRLVHGDVMYRDLTENKPPGGYWLYALTVAVGGARELTIRLMPIPFVLATIALVWWVARRLAGEAAGLVAAATYAVASTDPYMFGNGANMEHFLNLFATASLALLVAAWDRPGRGRLLAAGASLGAACLVKQVAITHALVYAVALLARRRLPGGDAPRSLSARGIDVAALGLGGGAVVGLAVLVLVAQGAGPAAFDDIVRYGGALATDTPPEPHAPPGWMRWVTGNSDPRNGQLPWPFGRTDYLVWWGTGTWPLWLAALPALLWLAAGARGEADSPDRSQASDRRAEARLVAGWTASAIVQVALPGLFWPHYYLLPLPGLAIAVAVALADWVRRAIPPHGRSFLFATPALLLAAALAATAWIQYRDYLSVPAEELTIRYKGGRQWVTLRAMGLDLARRSRVWPDPHLYVWGWQSPLSFYSGLDGVSRHFFADPLLKAFAGKGHPLIEPRTRRIMEDLRAHPPELIFAGDPPFPALAAFLRERYLPSRLTLATPDGRGLWVERERYGAFETARAPARPSE